MRKESVQLERFVDQSEVLGINFSDSVQMGMVGSRIEQPNVNQLQNQYLSQGQFPGPGVGCGQPGMAQPGMAQPGMTQPGMTQPGMPQPGMNQPGMNQPGMNQPGMNQPGMNQPGMAQPGLPQPGPQGGMAQVLSYSTTVFY